MVLPTPRIGPYDYPTHFSDWQSIEPLQIPVAGVKVFFQDGVDDAGALVGSKRPKRASIRTSTLATSQSSAHSAALAFTALVGTLVRVVDEYGITWTAVIVEDVRYRIDPVLTPSQRYEVAVLWSLIPSSLVTG